MKPVSGRARKNIVVGISAGALAASILFLPVLMRSAVIPYDYEYYHFPLWRFIFDSIRMGQFPYYDPFTYAGAPFAANTQSMAYYPPVLSYFLILTLLGSDLTGYAAEYIGVFHFAVAYAGVYVWTRHRHASSTLAHAISLSAVFGGAWLANNQHAGFIGAVAWFPWLLLASDYVLEDPRPKRIIPVGILLSLIQLAGFLPIAMIENLLWGLYCFTAIVQKCLAEEIPLTIRSVGGRVVALILSQILHLLLTEISWMGAFVTLPEQPAVESHGLLPPQVLLTAISPNVFGHFSLHGFVGPADPTATYLFAGAIPFFALAALMRPLSAIRNVAFIVGLICLLLAIDPLELYMFIQRIPAIGILYRPELMFYFVPFFFATSLVQTSEDTVKKGAWIPIAVVMAATAFAITMIRSGRLQGSLLELCAGAVFICVALAVAAAPQARLSQPRLFLLFAIVLFAFHSLVPNRIWSVEGKPSALGPNTIDHDNRELIAALRESKTRYRVAADQKVLGAGFTAGWPVWRIESINGFEPVLDQTYRNYMIDGLARWSSERTFGDFDAASEKLGELNVLFLVADSRAAIDRTQWETAFDNQSVRIYRNRHFTPRFRLEEMCGFDDAVSLVSASPAKYLLNVTSSCDHSTLIASERPYPGWSVEVDGSRVGWRARNPAIGIDIPISSGSHIVSIAYETPRFLSILGVEGVGLMMILVFVAADRIGMNNRGRFRRPAARPASRRDSPGSHLTLLARSSSTSTRLFSE
jgi:uncharacterized membrane protein